MESDEMKRHVNERSECLYRDLHPLTCFPVPDAFRMNAGVGERGGREEASEGSRES